MDRSSVLDSYIGAQTSLSALSAIVKKAIAIVLSKSKFVCMESRAYGVLGGKMGRIKGSNVDPAWLAGQLLAAHVIGEEDATRATREGASASSRLEELVVMVTRNGRDGVFRKFVDILLSKPHIEWLGEEIKGS